MAERERSWVVALSLVLALAAATPALLAAAGGQGSVTTALACFLGAEAVALGGLAVLASLRHQAVTEAVGEGEVTPSTAPSSPAALVAPAAEPSLSAVPSVAEPSLSAAPPVAEPFLSATGPTGPALSPSMASDPAFAASLATERPVADR